MSIRRRSWAVALAAITALMTMAGTANAAPDVSSQAFGAGTIKLTMKLPQKGTTAGTDYATTAVTCYLGGSAPQIVADPVETTKRKVHVSASLNCPGASGLIELTVGLEQRAPGGGYVRQATRGPLTSPAPLFILGVYSAMEEPPCFQINSGPWRGVVRPRFLGSNGLVCDWGWFVTRDFALSC
jgi:hypothetical protein